MKLTQAQFQFLRRIGSNNFNADTPTRTINSNIRLGLAVKMDVPNYYQITQTGAELLAKILWEGGENDERQNPRRCGRSQPGNG